MRVTNAIPHGCSLLLPVGTVNCVQTLKEVKLKSYDSQEITYNVSFNSDATDIIAMNKVSTDTVESPIDVCIFANDQHDQPYSNVPAGGSADVEYFRAVHGKLADVYSTVNADWIPVNKTGAWDRSECAPSFSLDGPMLIFALSQVPLNMETYSAEYVYFISCAFFCSVSCNAFEVVPDSDGGGCRMYSCTQEAQWIPSDANNASVGYSQIASTPPPATTTTAAAALPAGPATPSPPQPATATASGGGSLSTDAKAGIAVGCILAAVVGAAAVLLVRRRIKRSAMGWGEAGGGKRKLKQELCAAVKTRAALTFLATYSRALFADIKSTEEYIAVVAELEIPRARLKPRGVIGCGNYGQVKAASVTLNHSFGAGGGRGGERGGDGAGVGADPNGDGYLTIVGTNEAGSWHSAGGSGVVVKQVAVKSRLPTENDATVDEALLIEALVMHSLHHPYVLGLVGVCTTALPFLVATELMVNGDLKSYLRACRPSQPKPKASLVLLDAILVAERVCAALAHLESVAVIHRDVAARNILVGAEPTDVKLGDLGAARSVFRSAECEYTVRFSLFWLKCSFCGAVFLLCSHGSVLSSPVVARGCDFGIPRLLPVALSAARV
jgi:hypothetical protein